jgi:hypothetical protein
MILYCYYRSNLLCTLTFALFFNIHSFFCLLPSDPFQDGGKEANLSGTAVGRHSVTDKYALLDTGAQAAHDTAKALKTDVSVVSGRPSLLENQDASPTSPTSAPPPPPVDVAPSNSFFSPASSYLSVRGPLVEDQESVPDIT